jgi:hypothetical protein
VVGHIAVLPIAVALAVAAAAPASAPPPAIDVGGTATCPSPALVAASLRPLLPADATMPADARLEVDDVSPAAGPKSQIEVRLVHAPSGAPLASRRLDKYGSCEETAQALAVVIATWVARYSPVPSSTLPLPDPKAAGALPVLVLARPRASSLLVSVGAGAGLVAAGRGSSAPFAAVELDARDEDRPWVIRLSVVAVGERTLAFGPGVAAWSRMVASPGVSWRWGGSAAFAEIGLGALIGAAFVEGRGFARDQQAVSLDLGGVPWARVGARLAAVPVTVWLGGGALVWAREQRVSVESVPGAASLPRVDAMLGGGVAWAPDRRGAPGH